MIDVTHQINSVERTVGSRTLAAGEARTVTISKTYPSPLEDVWDAVTNPERIPRWFLPVSGDLTVGGRYQLEGNAGGTVERCDAPTSFAATWEYGEEVSWIEVTLVAESDDRTRMVLDHIAHVSDERWTEFGPGAVGVGWDLGLIGLSLHLASAAAVDPAEVAGWMMSAAGRDFVTQSSDGWFRAQVASGEDTDAARASADRTTAFYTAVPPTD